MVLADGRDTSAYDAWPMKAVDAHLAIVAYTCPERLDIPDVIDELRARFLSRASSWSGRAIDLVANWKTIARLSKHKESLDRYAAALDRALA